MDVSRPSFATRDVPCNGDEPEARSGRSPFTRTIRGAPQAALERLEAAFDGAFGPGWNPLRHLGALSYFFFWVAAVSGIYVYVLFETTATGAYSSVEDMTIDQWYAGGVMRSLHRYSSDALVVTLALHLAQEFVLGRYRGVRWYAWFTGVPLIWFVYISGISGYWLVWDLLAQYVAVGSMEWLDWFAIFGEPVANNFLTRGSLDDRFFSLLVFIHIFVPLFLLLLMWVHVLRLSRPRVNPPMGLGLGCLAMLVVLSLVKPATSHAPADLASVPLELGLDWFYMAFYPLFDLWGAGPLWALTIGSSLVLCALPWLPPLRQPTAAMVTLAACNGCERCYDGCPQGAVTMRTRSDGLPFNKEPAVDASLCTRCGICVGACPSSTPFRHATELVTGIDLPDFRLAEVRRLTDAGLGRLGAGPGVVVFGCDHGVEVGRLEGPGVGAVSLPCIAMLPPSFIDYALGAGGADGIVLTGCREGGCYNRFGIAWTGERLAGQRDPYLRKRVERRRIEALWAARTDGAALAADVAAFRARLAVPAEASAAPEA